MIYLLFYLTVYKERKIRKPKINDDELKKLELLNLKPNFERQKYNISCKRLFEMDRNEIKKAKLFLEKLRKNSDKEKIDLIPDSNYIFNKTQCELYKEIRGFNKYVKNKLITTFEYQFPLAYNILTYNNVEEFERLLLAIYRPQNVYCIHVDNKSSIVFKKAIESIVGCFDNIFITTQLLDIVYAGFNRLQADINCMNDLLNMSSKSSQMHPNFANKKLNINWKYLINMASSEFPLKTNYELTRILNMFNGSNEIEIKPHNKPKLIQYKYIVKYDKNKNPHMACTYRNKTQPPHNYTIAKGSAYNVFSHKFVEYATSNQYAKDLLAWGVDTYSPDEWLILLFLD